MPSRTDATPLTRGAVARGLLFGLAVLLGAVAVWLIVTGATDPKRTELGILAGLWGALLGAFALFGTRRPGAAAETVQPAAPAEDRTAERAEALTAEIELRSSAALERAADAEQRRQFEARLETLLGNEVTRIREAVSGEVADLRSDVAGLRAELLEKVGGQLRLERIETTRVIGSDLEALQHEVRSLKYANTGGDAGLAQPRRAVVEPARVRPVSRENAQVQADVQPAIQPAAAPRPVAAPAPVPVVEPQPAPAPAPPASAVPAPSAPQAAAPQQPAPQQPARPTPAADDGDPLASLPRITPFTAFDLDPIEPDPVRPATSERGPSGPAPADRDDDAYNGRRRRDAAGEYRPRRSRQSEEADEAARATGRGAHSARAVHSARAAHSAPEPTPPVNGSRRHRYADDSDGAGAPERNAGTPERDAGADGAVDTSNRNGARRPGRHGTRDEDRAAGRHSGPHGDADTDTPGGADRNGFDAGHGDDSDDGMDALSRLFGGH